MVLATQGFVYSVILALYSVSGSDTAKRVKLLREHNTHRILILLKKKSSYTGCPKVWSPDFQNAISQQLPISYTKIISSIVSTNYTKLSLSKARHPFKNGDHLWQPSHIPRKCLNDKFSTSNQHVKLVCLYPSAC